jgi:hypothetical protein
LDGVVRGGEGSLSGAVERRPVTTHRGACGGSWFAVMMGGCPSSMYVSVAGTEVAATWGGGLVGASVVVVAMVLSGCAGYSKQEIRRDALQLLPPGAHNLSYYVSVGDGFNPTMSATVEFRARSGTPKQRYAQYLAIARQHGWKLKALYNPGPRSIPRRSRTATPTS